MKHLSAIAFVCLLVFTACNKTPNSSTTTPKPTTPTDSFVVSGGADVTLGNADSNILALAVAHVSGEQKKITFSISGLPSTIKATFDPASGMAPFGTILRLNTHIADVKTHTATVTATSESGKTQSFNININVTGTANCNEYFSKHADGAAGSIQTTVQGSTDVIHTATTLGYKSIVDSVLLLNLYLRKDPMTGEVYKSVQGTPANAMVNCAAKTITIPEHYIAGSEDGIFIDAFTISGSGTIDVAGKTFTINYTTRMYNNPAYEQKFTLKGKLK